MTTAFTTADLSLAVQHLADRLDEIEIQLNSADSKLGDGDTGTMLARMGRGLSAVSLDSTDDLGAAFMLLTRAALSSTGSSLGTLIGTALMTLAQNSKGQSTIEWPDISPMLDKAVAAMSARGKSELGDKTILDSLHAIARATENAESREQFIAMAQAGAQSALDELRDQPCKIGRARMYHDQSIGMDDPGMLAMALMLR